jgi:uncharacterized protein
MPLTINLRHLEEEGLPLKGELPVEELDLQLRDEVVQAHEPLKYDFQVEKHQEGLLLQGQLRLDLDCECVRCLKPVKIPLKIDEWACHVPLSGDEAAPIVNDQVDLTPYVREDILLEFPQHPLCDPGCGGLPSLSTGKPKKTKSTGPAGASGSTWAELNKLRF